MDPIPIAELREFRSVYPSFVIDVFHGKVIQTWNDLLHSLVALHLDLHLSGERSFTELRARQVRLDFADDLPVLEQLRHSVLESFDFDKYQDRFRLVERTMGAGPSQEASRCIRCHVHIRNCIQHHHGLLNDFVFKDLGCKTMELVNDDGDPRPHKEGDKVQLSGPELDRLRRALLQVVP